MALHIPQLASLDKNMMHYVYLLRSYKTGKFYLGCTKDIQRRLNEHNNGLSRSTRGRGPFEVIYYEAYKFREDAENREMTLKRNPTLIKRLKGRLKVTLALASSQLGDV